MKRSFVSKASGFLALILGLMGIFSPITSVMHGAALALSGAFFALYMIFKFLKDQKTDEDLHAQAIIASETGRHKINPKGFVARAEEEKHAHA